MTVTQGIFLQKTGRFELRNVYLMENNSDLKEVRNRMKQIYWPGDDLESVAGYIGQRAEQLYSTFEDVNLQALPRDSWLAIPEAGGDFFKQGCLNVEKK